MSFEIINAIIQTIMGMSLFPALFDRPDKIRFADQENDEHIELFLRQHWFTNIPWILILILGLVLPLSLPPINTLLNFDQFFKIPGDIFLAVIILWYMFVLLFTLQKILYWYFNIYIVTDKYLVDINFRNLMSRDITEVRLDDVQSAASTVKGIAGALFNYGDVIIETAAERQQIHFASVPKPDFVKERIQDLQDLQEGTHGVS